MQNHLHIALYTWSTSEFTQMNDYLFVMGKNAILHSLRYIFLTISYKISFAIKWYIEIKIPSLVTNVIENSEHSKISISILRFIWTRMKENHLIVKCVDLSICINATCKLIVSLTMLLINEYFKNSMKTHELESLT